METISVRSLTKDYGGGKGIFDISLSIRQGEVYGFLGPNRRGKIHDHPSSDGILQARFRQGGNSGNRMLSRQKAIQPHVGYLPVKSPFPMI